MFRNISADNCTFDIPEKPVPGQQLVPNETTFNIHLMFPPVQTLNDFNILDNNIIPWNASVPQRRLNVWSKNVATDPLTRSKGNWLTGT